MSSDWILISWAIGIIVCITGLTQWLGIQWVDRRNSLRKILHFLVIGICAYVIHHIDDTVPLIGIFLIGGILLLGVVRFHVLNISQGKSYGIALFPLAFALLLSMDGIDRSFIVAAIVILAIADPLASIAGNRFAKSFWKPLFEKKSLVGSLVFFLSAAVLLALGSYPMTFPAILLVASLTTFSEMYTWRGSDNFFIPIVGVIALTAIQLHGWQSGLWSLLIVGGAVIPLVRMHWLTLSGALAVVMMATWIVLMISPIALLPPVVFLVLGSMASRLNKGSASMARDDTSGRTAAQVFANGGMGMVIAVPYLLTHQHIYLVLFALVFATTLSDTLSSEVGRYFKGMTYSVRNFRKVAPGISGGISLLGTLAGAVGSTVMALLSYFIFNMSPMEFWLVSALGFLGMLLDSWMGAQLQGKYVVHGILMEEGEPEQLVSGYFWIDNSMVNFLSVTGILLIGYFAIG